jgi:hypothetical protein
MITGCVRTFAAIASLCVSLLALIIVIYVSIKLVDISFDGVDYEFYCLLGTNENLYTFSSNNCLMLQILSGLTIGVGLLVGIIQCYTCNLCGLGGILDGIFSLLGAGSWGYAAGVINTAVNSNGELRTKYESGVSLPGPANLLQNVDVSLLNDDYNSVVNQRDATRIMCWIEFGLFCFLLFASLLKCCPGRHK